MVYMYVIIEHFLILLYVFQVDMVKDFPTTTNPIRHIIEKQTPSLIVKEVVKLNKLGTV